MCWDFPGFLIFLAAALRIIAHSDFDQFLLWQETLKESDMRYLLLLLGAIGLVARYCQMLCSRPVELSGVL
jgi:hypothetical protein